MKKILFTFLLTVAGAAAFAQGPTKGTQPASVKQKADTMNVKAPAADSTQKLFSIQGTIEAYQALITALDKSTEGHLYVEAIKQWIIPQLQKQLPAATRPKQ